MNIIGGNTASEWANLGSFVIFVTDYFKLEKSRPDLPAHGCKRFLCPPMQGLC
jgi:hypothetical protein